MDSYVVIDVETTGFNSQSDDIIQIGAWRIENGVAVSCFDTLVKPTMSVPREVTKITGITNEMVASELTFEEICPDLMDFVGDLPLLGHNLIFDYTFISTKAKRAGYDFTKKGLRTGICTLKLARKYLSNIPSRKLGDLADFFKINLEGGALHNAKYDAYMTKLIYDRFKDKYSNISTVVIPEYISQPEKSYGKETKTETLSFT